MFCEAEGNIMADDKREPSMNPAQSETPGMSGNSVRENRETAAAPAKLAGRPEKPKAQVRDARGCGVERLHSTDAAYEQEAGDCQAE